MYTWQVSHWKGKIKINKSLSFRTSPVCWLVTINPFHLLWCHGYIHLHCKSGLGSYRRQYLAWLVHPSSLFLCFSCFSPGSWRSYTEMDKNLHYCRNACNKMAESVMENIKKSCYWLWFLNFPFPTIKRDLMSSDSILIYYKSYSMHQNLHFYFST